MNRKNLSESIGKYTGHAVTELGLDVQTENAVLQLEIWRPGVVRVRIRKPLDYAENVSYAIDAEPETFEWSMDNDDKRIRVLTGDMEIHIATSDIRITFYDEKGRLLNADDPAIGTNWNGTEVATYKTLQEGERFIGLGEKTGPLDRAGNAYVNWNTDEFGYATNADPLYCSTPFYMGLHGGIVYGIFLNNSYKSTFNFGASSQRFSWFSADDGEMDYFFFGGGNVADIVANYSWLTGKMQLPPRWALGFQQCRYSYYPDSEVLSVARTFREKRIPADVIYLDIHYMQDYKVFTFHEERFPNPEKLCQELRDMGFRVVLIVDPGIKVEEGYEAYEEALEKDYFVTYPDGKPWTAQVWPGWSAFPDFTREEVRDWWGQQFSVYTEAGIEGFWNDMNEPACWGQTPPNLIEFGFEGEGATHRQARNVYGHNMARATKAGTEQLMNGNRPFILTRAGFSGIQRYAAVWTGDNVASDEHMLAGVRLVNSMGLTGIPFAGYDVGGFAEEGSPELYARWIALGAFSPFFRGHSIVNSRDSEPWSYGEQVEEVARNFIGLRYQLMPYLYSVFYEASQNGLPVSRSLAFEWAHDPKIYEPGYENEYTFGPSILVAPAASDKEIVKVYLPEGNWYDMMTDQPMEGGKEHYVELGIERLPLYVAAGAVIPMQSLVQSDDEQPEDVMRLHVYAGGNTEFLYYEDDGITLGAKGLRRRIRHDGDAGELLIEQQIGDFVSHFRTLRIYFHGCSESLTPVIKGDSLEVEEENVEWMQGITQFDPMGPAASESQGPKSVPYVEIPWTEDSIELRYR